MHHRSATTTVRALGALLLGFVLALTGCSAGPATTAGTHAAPAAAPTSRPRAMPTIQASALPPEARHTLQLIEAGGPFPYSRDGVVYANREGLLPHQRTGYYHEYTVPTPSVPGRGARRIVTGAAGEIYYTDDHYRSFQAVVGR